MNDKRQTLSVTVCTGAQMQVTINSGDALQDNYHLRHLLEQQLEKNDSLTRQLDYRQQSNGNEVTQRQALFNIRTALNDLGCNVEASEEYDFIQLVERELEKAGFPRPQLPAVINDDIPI